MQLQSIIEITDKMHRRFEISNIVLQIIKLALIIVQLITFIFLNKQYMKRGKILVFTVFLILKLLL